MNVFLTGGTGLIGSHIAERLRARGDGVVALVRPSSEVGHLRAAGCRLVEGNVNDSPDSLARAMDGCDAVVHSAALVFHRAPRQAFLRANVDGTRSVLEAAAVTAPRVIHLSSVAVYSGLPSEDGLTEERWTEANPDSQPAYPASKHQSEAAAWGLHEAGRIRLTTIRPSVIYGERDRAATPILVRLTRLPIIPLLDGGRTWLPIAYAGNVANGVLLALDRDAAAGRAYNLGQDHPVTARELITMFASELGRRARVLPVPARPAAAAAGVVDRLGAAVPFLPRTGLRRAVRSMIRDNPYDSARARLELGWSGLIPHHEGVRRTVRWWIARKSMA